MYRYGVALPVMGHMHVGRAIDLVLTSVDIELTMTIHNFLHCGGEEACPWGSCCEYAGGDHFFISLDVCFNVEKRPNCALPFFPVAWHDKQRWAKGFENVSPALR